MALICTSSSSENKRGFPLGSGDRVPHGAAPALQPGLRVQKASGCRRRSLTGHLLLPGRRSHPAREGRSQSWLLTSRRYRPCGGAEARKPVILQSYNLSQKSREKRKLRAGVWPRATAGSGDCPHESGQFALGAAIFPLPSLVPGPPSCPCPYV